MCSFSHFAWKRRLSLNVFLTSASSTLKLSWAGDFLRRHFVKRSQKVCMSCYITTSVKGEAGNHANFCGISKYVHVLQHFRVASLEYSSMANQCYLFFFYVFWTITWFDHSYSLYPKMGKFKQRLNFTHRKFLLWGSILAQPPNFKGEIFTEARECRNFAQAQTLLQ